MNGPSRARAIRDAFELVLDKKSYKNFHRD